MTDKPSKNRDLERLGQKLDSLQRQAQQRKKPAPPSMSGLAFRFSTELVSAVVVGGAIGLGLDWLFGTRFLVIVFFVLGAAAGIRNVMNAAAEMNAEMAKAPPPPAVRSNDEDEES